MHTCRLRPDLSHVGTAGRTASEHRVMFGGLLEDECLLVVIVELT